MTLAETDSTGPSILLDAPCGGVIWKPRTLDRSLARSSRFEQRKHSSLLRIAELPQIVAQTRLTTNNACAARRKRGLEVGVDEDGARELDLVALRHLIFPGGDIGL